MLFILASWWNIYSLDKTYFNPTMLEGLLVIGKERKQT